MIVYLILLPPLGHLGLTTILTKKVAAPPRQTSSPYVSIMIRRAIEPRFQIVRAGVFDLLRAHGAVNITLRQP